MLHTRTRCALFLAVLFPGLMVGCGGDEEQAAASPTAGSTSASSSSAASTPAAGSAPAPAAAKPAKKSATTALPEHNPEARFNGKTALEYAADLTDLNPEVQMRAIAHLAQFKVDALPARDEVKAVLESRSDEVVKVSALSLLNTMQDPEAPALVRAALVDPAFAERDETLVDLLRGVKADGVVPAEALRDDMVALVKTDPDHATRLMLLQELPAEAQQGLEVALFETDHNVLAAAYFMGKLASFDSVAEGERIDYVLANIDAARQSPEQTLAMLRQIGTQEAMEAAIQLVPEGPNAWQHRYQQMQMFAAAKVDAVTILETMREEMQQETDGTRIATVASYMAAIPPLVFNAQPRTDEQQAKAARAMEAFYAAMETMLRDGPTQTHQGVAIQNLVGFTQQNVNRGASGSAMIDTLCRVVADAQTEQIVRNTIWQQLAQAGGFIRIDDPEQAAAAFAAVIWSGQSVDTNVITRLSREAAARDAVIRALLVDADSHIDTPAVNPALIVLLELMKTSQLWRTDLQQEACPTLGRLAASPHADLTQLEKYMTSYTMLAHPRQNFAPGSIALLEPIVFADGPTVLHDYINKNRHTITMMNQLFAAGNQEWAAFPEQQTAWQEFLQRAAASSDELFKGFAGAGLGGG